MRIADLDMPLNALSTSTVEIIQDAQPSVAVLPVSPPDDGMDPDAIEDDDDDLPGFDDFLAHYKSTPEAISGTPAAQTTIENASVSEDVCLLPETTEFMDEVRKIVNDAATQESVSVPSDSADDGLTVDTEQRTESDTDIEVVSDFWF